MASTKVAIAASVHKNLRAFWRSALYVDEGAAFRNLLSKRAFLLIETLAAFSEKPCPDRQNGRSAARRSNRHLVRKILQRLSEKSLWAN